MKPGIQLLLDDGLPASLIIDQAARATAWKGRRLTTIKPFIEKPVEDPATKAFRLQLEKDQAAKDKAKKLARAEQRVIERKQRSQAMAPKGPKEAQVNALKVARATQSQPQASAPASTKETTPMTAKTAKKAPAKKATAKTMAKAKKSAVKTTAAKAPKAPKAAKPPKVPKPAGERARYDWREAEAKAILGTVPKMPDFSAPTHAPFKSLIDEVASAAKSGDVDVLAKIKINPTSSTPKAIDRYRKLAVTALKHKAA